ncbi:MAG: copper-translocating P-type ATPase [Spirochaetales bacterium]|nr:copper-translocating P-type ATPase [Spirochaetales bacterium]
MSDQHAGPAAGNRRGRRGQRRTEGGQGQRHSGHDHGEHHRMMVRDFRRRFYISTAATAPILALSPLIQGILGFSLSFPGSPYVLLGLSSFVFFYGGWPFLKGLFEELGERQPGMMTLIALAISVAYLYSAAVVLGLEGRFFFWELATLVDVMLAGHWIEMRSVLSASRALEELARLMPDTAHRKSEAGVEDVPLSEVRSGDLLVIKPGEKVPSDGTIVTGHSAVDESMLTGEAVPVEKEEGQRLIGGSINGDGALEMRVEGTGEESYLARVIGMVRESQAAKSRTQGLADRAAFWLTIIALTVGGVTLAAWLIAGRDLQFSIARMATVMVITCPHALGLAIPLVVAVSTSKSAQNGLLIRNRTAFENARRITTVLFDKTGTLTRGRFEVTDVQAHGGGYDEGKVLRLAAALEQGSEHPIGRGILARAREQGVEVGELEDFEAIKGKGVEGRVDGRPAAVVSPGYLKEQGLGVPEGAEARAGVSRVFVQADGEVVGSIGLSDTIRPESYGAVRRLQRRGIECWMITGDNRETAEAVGGELGMDGVFAEVLPEQKQEKVRELQERGEYVAMTGDGINDAPALARAQIGIAIGSGTDVAAETADIILVNSNPQDVSSLILFGRATYRKMVQNLIWATAYNVVAIPLAAGALYNLGIVISPAIGALLMSLSTVIVAINARLLRVEKPEAGQSPEAGGV